ncbi:MAG: Mur ligase family protein, partial [Nostocoides sp.]
GLAHVGEFGSRDAIATAKAELVEALPAGGIAVLNADDAAVRAMAWRTAAEVVLVGEGDEADVRAAAVTLDTAGRPSFRLLTAVGNADVRLGLVGRHHVGNALSVAAMALACGVGLTDIAVRLSAARPASRWRMEVTERADGVVVVNDAYNANPDSMRAALDAVQAMGISGRRWAVLGSMLELGEEAEADHADIGREAVRSGIDELVVVGEVAAPMVAGAEAESAAAGAQVRVRRAADADAAYELVTPELRRGDVVLLKSSRDAGLRWLGERIADGSENPEVPSTQQGEGR